MLELCRVMPTPENFNKTRPLVEEYVGNLDKQIGEHMDRIHALKAHKQTILNEWLKSKKGKIKQ